MKKIIHHCTQNAQSISICIKTNMTN